MATTYWDSESSEDASSEEAPPTPPPKKSKRKDKRTKTTKVEPVVEKKGSFKMLISYSVCSFAPLKHIQINETKGH